MKILRSYLTTKKKPEGENRRKKRISWLTKMDLLRANLLLRNITRRNCLSQFMLCLYVPLLVTFPFISSVVWHRWSGYSCFRIKHDYIILIQHITTNKGTGTEVCGGRARRRWNILHQRAFLWLLHQCHVGSLHTRQLSVRACSNSSSVF